MFYMFMNLFWTVPQLNPKDKILNGAIYIAIVIASVPINIVPESSIVTETIIGI